MDIKNWLVILIASSKVMRKKMRLKTQPRDYSNNFFPSSHYSREIHEGIKCIDIQELYLIRLLFNSSSFPRRLLKVQRGKQKKTHRKIKWK